MKYIYFQLLIFLFACGSEQIESFHDNNLYGEWKLDSISINMSKQKSSIINEITFYEDGRYKQSKWNGDVGNRYVGRFYINNNPKRKFITITLIPDIIIDKKDTILVAHQNLDIVELSNNQLVICSPTEWVKKGDGQSYEYNKKSYFIKQK